MKWIKVSENNEISVNSMVLLANIATDQYYVGCYVGGGYFEIKSIPFVIPIVNFTHYCVIEKIDPRFEDIVSNP